MDMTFVGNRVFIIDDSSDHLEYLSGVIREEGFEVRTALTGAEGYGAICNEIPGVVILDARMPDMDGFEVCELLKQNHNTRDIPVIFLSAYNNLQDKIRAFEVGAVDYVTKPYHQEEIIVRLRTQLELRRLVNELEIKNRILEENNRRLKEKQEELEKALCKVELLKGLIPICANCKKVRDDEGFWQHVEAYIADHSDARFSHSVCPDCADKYYRKYLNP